jgi:AcrR family transcriptional regulator
MARSANVKTAYHHGDLRRALLEEGLDMVERLGVDEVTLAALAKKTGVSVAAPYRHFETKEDLVRELSELGMLRFRDALAAACRGSGGAEQQLRRAGFAVVRFAQRSPRVYQLIFGAARSNSLTDLRNASDETAFGVLRRIVLECQREGVVGPGDPIEIAISIWAAIHGLASLLSSGRLRAESEREVKRFTTSLLDVVLRGLA